MARTLAVPTECWVDAHAPDEGGGLDRGEGLRDALHLRLRHAGDVLDGLGIVFLDLLADIVHAVNARGDEVLVFPAVLEDVPHQAPDHGDVGAGAEADIIGGVGGSAGQARVKDDDVGALDFLAFEDVLHRDRVSLGSVGAHEEHGLGVADVVIGVRHRAVAPGVRDTCDRGGVADAGLMVDVVRAPESSELAEQVGALIGELGGPQQINRIRAGLVADLHHLVADLVDRDIPADALPLTIDQLHRVLDAAVAMDQLAHRGALGAVAAAVDRAFPGRLLANPDAIGDLGLDRAADRAMGADVLDDLGAGRGTEASGGFSLADGADLQGTGGGDATCDEAGAAQEGAAVHHPGREASHGGLQLAALNIGRFALDEHWFRPSQYRLTR